MTNRLISRHLGLHYLLADRQVSVPRGHKPRRNFAKYAPTATCSRRLALTTLKIGVVKLNRSAEVEQRVDVLKNLEDVDAEVFEYGMPVAAQLGRMVLSRSFGNHHTPATKWLMFLIRHAFTLRLQRQMPLALSSDAS